MSFCSLWCWKLKNKVKPKELSTIAEGPSVRHVVWEWRACVLREKWRSECVRCCWNKWSEMFKFRHLASSKCLLLEFARSPTSSRHPHYTLSLEFSGWQQKALEPPIPEANKAMLENVGKQLRAAPRTTFPSAVDKYPSTSSISTLFRGTHKLWAATRPKRKISLDQSLLDKRKMSFN